MMVSLKEAARRIREHNRICYLEEPLNSPIITEILEMAAVMFEQIDEGIYKPVIHGHWSKEMHFTEDFMGNRTYGYKCSVCGKLANRLQFCGNCGAKMDESEDAGNE